MPMKNLKAAKVSQRVQLPLATYTSQVLPFFLKYDSLTESTKYILSEVSKQCGHLQTFTDHLLCVGHCAGFSKNKTDNVPEHMGLIV